jgi:2',3'-cyclic-nucleotide 2'-phosphodiesterase (5'-nucleotidase family)
MRNGFLHLNCLTRYLAAMLRLSISLSILLIISCGDSAVLHDSIAMSAQVRADSTTEAFIRPFRDNMKEDMARVLVRSNGPILRGRPDSPLGSLMADLVLQEAQEMADSLQVNVNACMLNIGGFRIDLPEGDITVAHVYELMPFENVLNLVLLTEEGVIQMARHLAEVKGQPVAGIRLTVTEGGDVNLEINGKPYKGGPLWVVTSDYLADGGDHMTFFEERLQRIESGRMLRDVLMRQLAGIGASGNGLTAPSDRRISIKE